MAENMRKFAFKNRLFVTYTAVITLVVALFTVVLLTSMAGVNRETELYHQQEMYKNNLAEVEGVLLEMDRLASQIVSNNEILGTFIPLHEDESGTNYFAENLIDAIRVSSLLSSINRTDNFAARVSLFTRGGDYVSTGTLYETTEKIEALLSTPAYYDEMMERIVAGGRDSLVLDFHEDTWSDNSSLRLISLYRTLASYTGRAYGLVDIQVGADVFGRSAFWDGQKREYLLVNRQGEIIYPFIEANGVGALLQTLLAAADAGDGVTVLEGRLEDRGDVLLMASPVALSDWTFVRVMSAGDLLAPYTNGYVVMVLGSLLLWVCLVLVVNYLAVRITRPLGRLAHTIGSVNLQNMQRSLDATEDSYSTLELNALNDAFRDMLTRLDKSVAMEIQAHMRALQSQMNPHFLYNMLSVIIESSEEEGSPRTVSMCLKLSSMLRYIADYDGDTASLAEELEHTRNYLDLMKDRYEEMFTYAIEVDPGLETVYVPKMIIQPLAENCFSHGFRNCRPPWHIGVEVRVAEGRWLLSVTDNGTGMAPEVIADIHARVALYRSDMGTNYKNLKLGGMGLVNTLLRLSLSRQGDIDFAVEENPAGGTIIHIGGDSE